MKASVLIDRIKSECPEFGGRVGGSASAAAAKGEDDLAVPHAFVVPAGSVSRPADVAGPVTKQDIDETFQILVAVDNTTDAAGAAAGDVIDDLRASLIAALLGWPPTADRGPLEHVSDSFEDMTRARLWHAFEFATTTILTET